MQSVTKSYGSGASRRVALRSLTLCVKEGGVSALLGPNGSGKTTTIRILLGLIKPDSGSCRVLGANPQSNLRTVIDQVGAIHETPRFFPYFSARRNLEILASLRGFSPQTIPQLLQSVGLGGAEDLHFSKYSSGMKQRLGIAAVLLKDPQLLILDEPGSGLDAEGFAWMRQILREFVDEGRTVLLSSHLLSEVEAIADHVSIISSGTCIMSGSTQEIIRRFSIPSVVVTVDNKERAKEVLQRNGYAFEIEGDSIRVLTDLSRAADISRALAGARVYPTEIRPSLRNLEDIYLELTRRENAPNSQG